MAYERFRSTNFRPESVAKISQIDEILSEYEGQKLTARQVYYQCVARGLLENTVKNYKNLTVLLTDARYAGLIDWDIIEDRGREPDSPSEWNSIDDLMETALRAYRLPRHEGQTNHVELWVEKQALAGVLQPIARKWHATLMVNKGYSSASAMKVAADRMKEACGYNDGTFLEWLEEWRKRFASGSGGGLVELRAECREDFKKLGLRRPIVLYLGDHDPSGEDMVRDIRERLEEFGVLGIDVRKIALTMEQIKKFNPPPNPAKLSDSRSVKYIAKFGVHSWELDALPPRELTALVETAFERTIDWKLMQAVIAKETEDASRLRKALAKIKKER